MEYPTFFTGMTTSYMPRGIRMPEMVTIHEFGHNYWYGMVGSNEFEEAWLDEGINTYSEIKAMGHYYGADRSMIDFAGLRISDVPLPGLSVIGSGRFDPILKKSWAYISGGSYGLNVYAKAGLMLLTLEKGWARTSWPGSCGRISNVEIPPSRRPAISSESPRM